MIIYYLIILIYISFFLDFIVWPIPSEASTSSLIVTKAKKTIIKKMFLIMVLVISLIIYALPLFMAVNALLPMDDQPFEFRNFAGILISIVGRVTTLTAARVLLKKSNKELVRHSIFKYSRNPISLGIFLTLFGFSLIFNVWYMWVGWILYIVNIHFKIKIEENTLIKKYPEYQSYMSDTPRYIIL